MNPNQIPGEQTILQEEPLLQFFVSDHLPANLRPMAQAFAELAAAVVCDAPRNPERTVALRKLLEAKDCAVRALLYEHP